MTIRLADDVDVSRGNLLADPDRPPIVARELDARVCWMSERPLEPRAKLAVKHTTRSVRAIAEELVALTDIHSLEDVPGPERLELNDIGVVRLRLSEPLAVDPYAENRETGAFILIDEATNDTVGAGMVISAPMTWQFTLTGSADRVDRRADRHGRRLADDADPRDRLRLQADVRRRHRHPARRDLQVVRRDPASPARHRARAPDALDVRGLRPAVARGRRRRDADQASLRRRARSRSRATPSAQRSSPAASASSRSRSSSAASSRATCRSSSRAATRSSR